MYFPLDVFRFFSRREGSYFQHWYLYLIVFMLICCMFDHRGSEICHTSGEYGNAIADALFSCVARTSAVTILTTWNEKCMKFNGKQPKLQMRRVFLHLNVILLRRWNMLFITHKAYDEGLYFKQITKMEIHISMKVNIRAWLSNNTQEEP